MTSSGGPGPILIVDDHVDVRETLAEILDAHGFPVATAANGEEALKVMTDGPLPSVVLLDVRMPVMDGAEFRRRQMADPSLACVPVLLVSGADECEAKEAFPDVAGYCRKPIEVGELLTTLRAM